MIERMTCRSSPRTSKSCIGSPIPVDTQPGLIPVLQVGQTGVEFKKTILAKKTLHLDPAEMARERATLAWGVGHRRSERKQIS